MTSIWWTVTVVLSTHKRASTRERTKEWCVFVVRVVPYRVVGGFEGGRAYRNRSRTTDWRVGEGEWVLCSSANYNRRAMDGREAGKVQVPKG